METKSMTKEYRKEWIETNDYHWYLVDYDDGTTSLVHDSILSLIINCGHDQAEFGIVNMEQCDKIGEKNVTH